MQRPESTSNSSSISNIPHKEQTQQALKPIRYIHGHTPIKLTRQMLKNTHCYTVLSNVECQIETLKTSSKGTIRIKKIYRFRFDEDKIWVYKCNKSLAFDIKETPQCPSDAPCYSYDSMPAEYWLMYIYACRFMTIVRSKISKVIIYTDVAKAVLFDLPDLFEVRFFADSTRIIFGDVIRIVKASGEEFDVIDINSVTIPEDMKLLLVKASELHEQAKRENKGHIFPKVIGQKPKKSSTNLLTMK